jgi:Flp pilus assembly protein TadD
MTSEQLPFIRRIFNALLSYIHYLVQMVWPGHYAVFYPYPTGFSMAAVAIAVVLILLFTGLALMTFRSRPYIAFGWFWFVITLLPVIGLVQVGTQSHADRYTYVPLIGIFIALVWGVCDLTRNFPTQKPVLSVSGAVVITFCITLTREQIGYWKNSETLARHAIAVAPANPVALNMLGVALVRRGQLEEAIAKFTESARLAPHYLLAQANLGSTLFTKGRMQESIEHSRAAIQIDPQFAGAHANLGAALGSLGHVDEAIAELQIAVKLAPEDAQCRYNLGYAYFSKGRYDDAIAQYQELVRLQPGNASAQSILQNAIAARAAAGKTGTNASQH